MEGGDLKSSIGNYQQMILYMDCSLSSWCTFFFLHLAYSPKTVVQTKKRSKIWYCLFSSLSVAGKKAFLGSLRILISHCDHLNSVAEAVQVAAYL